MLNGETVEVELYDAEAEVVQHIVKLPVTDKVIEVILWQQKVYKRDEEGKRYIRSRYFVAPIVEQEGNTSHMTLK